MDIYENTTVYLICPAATATGGTLLMHQLGSLLLAQGIKACMVYVPFSEDAVPVPYRKYHIPYTDKVADRSENIVILPEVSVGLFYQHIRCIFWWMSVDNWAYSIQKALLECQEESFQQPLPWFYYFQPGMTVLHWAQSEYAYRFLLRNGVKENNICRVGDYLDPIFLQRSDKIDLAAKKDFVAFNPKKGAEFTMKLIQAAPDIHWMVIRNMSASEVEELLAVSKLYIDFGHHPGKDRIPREAVVSGCCLITGRRGAAGNDVDIPIADSYKFADEEKNIPLILQKIHSTLRDYRHCVQDFADYRQSILQERSKFAAEVRASLQPAYKAKPVKKAALLLFYEGTRGFWRMLREMDGLDVLFIVDDPAAGEILRDGYRQLPVISAQDAKFLYEEGRIDCFVGRKCDEIEILRREIACCDDDWWLV